MATRKNVPASAVRAFAATPEGAAALIRDGAKFPGSRGRLDPTTIATYHKENPRSRYETASEAEKATVTVPVVGLDKAGRKTTKQVTVTTEAARAALGHPAGKRGRFAKSDLSLALSAPLANEVASKFN